MNKITTYFSIFIIALGLIFIANGSVFAWDPPSQTPPNANTPAPINVSATAQIKLGDLSINTGGGLNYWLTKLGDSFALKNNAGQIKFILGQDGNAGLGIINPSQKLDVSGQIHATGDICTDIGGGVCLGAGGTADNDWQVVDNNMYSIPSGNVGIGITTPAQKLDVSGWIKAKGLVDGDNQSYDVDPAATSDLKCIKLGTTGSSVERCNWPLSAVNFVSGGPSQGSELTVTASCNADEIRTGCSGGVEGIADCNVKAQRTYPIANGCATYGKASSFACGVGVKVYVYAYCAK